MREIELIAEIPQYKTFITLHHILLGNFGKSESVLNILGIALLQYLKGIIISLPFLGSWISWISPSVKAIK